MLGSDTEFSEAFQRNLARDRLPRCRFTRHHQIFLFLLTDQQQARCQCGCPQQAVRNLANAALPGPLR